MGSAGSREPKRQPCIGTPKTRKASLMRLNKVVAAAAALMCLGSSPAALAQSGDGSTARMRQWAESLAYRYLEVWSSGNAQALADVEALYGPRVNFYGRSIGQSALFDQKRRFGQRWPVRRYSHRPGTVQVTCDATSQACLVRSIVDWEAASPGRRAYSRGSSTLELGLGFAGPRPVVLFERGRVLSGRRAA